MTEALAGVETLTATIDGAVGRLTLRRPDVRNALSRQVLREIVVAATWFDDHEAMRVVVVGGEGVDFSSGYDLRDLATALTSDLDLHDPEVSPALLGAAMADAVDGMRAVTVAALHGNVVGGGAVLALGCDFRIAADDTRLLIPEIDLGIPLGWGGLHRLVAEIGPTRTKEIVVTCRPVAAEELAALGLVSRVTPVVDLDTAVDDLVSTVLRKPRGPVETTCRQVDAVRDGLNGAAETAASTDALIAAVSDEAFIATARTMLERLGID